MADFRALSIRQPWAWAIINGLKGVENRTWKSNYRGRLFVHAAKYEDLDSVSWVMARAADQLGIATHQAMESYLRHRDLGCVIGEVQMIGCVEGRDARPQDPWYFGPCGFVLSDPIRYKPIPCRGHLGIFPLPDWFDENLLQGM